MLLTLLEVLFKGIGYCMVIYAMWLLLGNRFYNTYIKSGIRKYRTHKRIKRLQELEHEQDTPKTKTALTNHLEILLSSVSNKGNVNVANFVMLSITIFAVSFSLVFILIGDPVFSLITSLVLGVSPYLLIIYRLETMRSKTSNAFMNEFHVILQNYQSTNKNIYYTLLNTTQELDDKYMKRQFRKLISSFQKERHENDFKKQVHIFMFSINSNFAKRFGNLLIKAHLESVDIGHSLSNLSTDITDRKKNMEYEATERLQTVLVGFAPIFVLPMMVFFAYQLSGVVDFWHYFKNPTNLTLFIIAVILSIISVLLAFLVRKPKADI